MSVSIAALVIAAINYFSIKKMDEGTEDMQNLAKLIRDGADTFMKIQFMVIAIVVAIGAIMITLFIERSSGLTFLLGVGLSTLACIPGMKCATYANVRVTNVARKTQDIGKTVQAAFKGGSVCGLLVMGLALLGFCIVFLITGGFIDPTAKGSGLITKTICNPFITRFITYSMGCSIVAMFNRVAGGNFTKAADVGSDITGKIHFNLPEDARCNPCTIADFIGDCINDIAGNLTDLMESLVASASATLMIGVTIYNSAVFHGAKGANIYTFNATMTFPILFLGFGLLGCVIGILITLFRKLGSKPSRDLNLTTYISAGLTLAGGLIASYVCFRNVELYDSFKLGWISPFVSAMLGIASGVAIGAITEYYTSTDYKPTRMLARIAPEGSAFLITKGDALGSKSCMPTILVLGITLLFSGKIGGLYGIAVSALGMLSFVATTVSIDAFGPIADNAGGIAEGCELPPTVRAITDLLDAVGNTTAAIGKGFAIGSASLATCSLIVAYVNSYTEVGTTPVLNIANFVVVAGGIVGGALIEFFSAILADNTIDSAKMMADEATKQLRIPGVIEGTVQPDYITCIKIVGKNALKKMIIPSLLAVFVPIGSGKLFGVEFVGGLLVGEMIVAIPRAIFNGNSGGAFDNAKKYIEAGHLTEDIKAGLVPGIIDPDANYGKGSESHKVSVVGDTTGDTRKDVIGVDLDIFMKLTSTVANAIVPIIQNNSLFM